MTNKSSIRESGLVSIIIPNYNHAHYVAEAINSVLAQGYDRYEIIVVDDGSTDNSREVIGHFTDKVQYIHKKNAGLSAARNTGIRQAKGEFIGVLDADDMVEPDFMSTLVPILQANQDAEAVYCGYQFVDESNRSLPQREARLIPEGQIFQALVDGNFLVPESILVRKRCYDSVGLFDESFRACEDVDMWLRITKQYKVLGVTNLLTRHRVLPNSMSADPTRQTQNRLAMIQKHFGPKPSVDFEWTDPQRRAYGQAYLASAVEYLQARKTDRAYDSFREMAFACPDLLTRLNTFYELGCGEQPKGYRGDFESLNMESNSRMLVGFLDRFFRESHEMDAIQKHRRAAYSQTYFALGLLNYGSSHLRDTRKCLVLALKYDLALFFNRRLMTTFIKSFVSTKIIRWYRGNRPFTANRHPAFPVQDR